MNKTELAEMVAAKSGMTKKDSEGAVSAVLEGITDTMVKGEKVQLVGFGAFEVREYKERNGRNPNTGETIKLAAQKMPAFKPGKALKDKVK